MGEFIEIVVNQDKCQLEECGSCISVCPVNVFAKDDTKIVIIEENEDECTLCELCLQECKANAIFIKKLYET